MLWRSSTKVGFPKTVFRKRFSKNCFPKTDFRKRLSKSIFRKTVVQERFVPKRVSKNGFQKRLPKNGVPKTVFPETDFPKTVLQKRLPSFSRIVLQHLFSPKSFSEIVVSKIDFPPNSFFIIFFRQHRFLSCSPCARRLAPLGRLNRFGHICF